MHTQLFDVVLPDATTRIQYRCANQDSFCVLQDESTVLGAGLDFENVIIKETISDHSAPILMFTENPNQIHTIAVNENNKTLFAADQDNFDGCVVQYDLETARVIKRYGDIGIGTVLSQTSLGSFWFLGGYRMNKFAVINTASRDEVYLSTNTSFETIYSLSVCAVDDQPEKRLVLLVLTGRNGLYYSDRTDVYDVTRLVTSRQSQTNNDSE